MRGGREHFGWGDQMHLLADQFMAITAMRGGDPIDSPRRPVIKKSKRKVSVKDLYNQIQNSAGQTPT